MKFSCSSELAAVSKNIVAPLGLYSLTKMAFVLLNVELSNIGEVAIVTG
jgi:hypothetical protein